MSDSAPQGPERGGLEGEGRAAFQAALAKLTNGAARFLRSSASKVHIAYEGRLTEVQLSCDDPGFVALLLELCEVTLASGVGRVAAQRLLAHAHRNAETMQLASFARYSDSQMYVPMSNGALLRLARGEVSEVENGHREIWVSHPRMAGFPIDAQSVQQSPRQGLLLFEERIVRQLTCRSPAMAWFCSVAEALGPFFRDILPERFIVVHQGPPNSGKTSGLELVLELLGLGRVRGDVSIAGLHAEDPGLLALDNVEHRDLSRSLLSYLLFVATGAERVRARRDGQAVSSLSRPLVSTTTVEGVITPELRRRCVVVDHALHSAGRSRRDREGAVRADRGAMLAALLNVAQRVISMAEPPTGWRPLTEPGFEEHYSLVAQCIRSIGEVFGRKGWADEILAECAESIRDSRSTGGYDELEGAVVRATSRLQHSRPYTREGVRGRLYVTTCAGLLDALQSVPGNGDLPRTPRALSARLAGSRDWQDIAVVTLDDDPGASDLRRTSASRPFGIFVPGLSASESGGSGGLPPWSSHTALPGCHRYLELDDACTYLWPYPAVADFIVGLKGNRGGQARDTQLRMIAEVVSAALSPALRTWAIVPIPPSQDVEHPAYDGRLEQLLKLVSPPIDVRPVLSQRCSIPRGSKLLAPSERTDLMVSSGIGPEPDGILLFDDVLTSGAHFAAAKAVLRREYNGPIHGLFLAGASSARSSVAAAGSGL